MEIKMRFLHTGDWHLGKTLRQRSRLGEQEAILGEILEIARAERVDAILIAGDVYESAVPSAEVEGLFFRFLKELWGEGIPAIIIGGNHDHPKRLTAAAGILELGGIHVIGEPLSRTSGGVLEIPSRDRTEIARIAALPWVPERSLLDVEDFLSGEGGEYRTYADRLSRMIEHLSAAFLPHTVNILVAHILLSGADVGKGEERGERVLHLGEVFALDPVRLPPTAQYIALGHAHRFQTPQAPAPCCYCGSIMQLDFGEEGQRKGVIIVEAHPGRPAHYEFIPLSKGRPLRTLEIGLRELPRVSREVKGEWLRVFIHADDYISDLPERVREYLPDAVEVRLIRPQRDLWSQRPRREAADPLSLIAEFYRSPAGRGRSPSKELLELVRKLMEEAADEAHKARA